MVGVCRPRLFGCDLKNVFAKFLRFALFGVAYNILEAATGAGEFQWVPIVIPDGRARLAGPLAWSRG